MMEYNASSLHPCHARFQSECGPKRPLDSLGRSRRLKLVHGHRNQPSFLGSGVPIKLRTGRPSGPSLTSRNFMNVSISTQASFPVGNCFLPHLPQAIARPPSFQIPGYPQHNLSNAGALLGSQVICGFPSTGPHFSSLSDSPSSSYCSQYH